MNLYLMSGYMIPQDIPNLYLDYRIFLIFEHLELIEKRLHKYDIPLPIVEWREEAYNNIFIVEKL